MNLEPYASSLNDKATFALCFSSCLLHNVSTVRLLVHFLVRFVAAKLFVRAIDVCLVINLVLVSKKLSHFLKHFFFSVDECTFSTAANNRTCVRG